MGTLNGTQRKTEVAHSRQGVWLTDPLDRKYEIQYGSKRNEFRLLCIADIPLGAKFCPRCGYPVLNHAWVVWLA